VTAVAREIADLQGEAALPRKNGELVFEAPWEGRAFGMAVVLHERGACAWEDFRARLVEHLGEGSGAYYEAWLAALEAEVIERGLAQPEELETRADEYRSLLRDPVF
jgi:nitrile hydratase accessory protein